MSLSQFASVAIAQAAPAADTPSTLMSLAPILLMGVVVYFLMIRPQMKRQKEHRNLVSNIEKGDEIITAGGMLGKVLKVHDTYLTIDISADADKEHTIVIQKAAIGSVIPKGTLKSL